MSSSAEKDGTINQVAPHLKNISVNTGIIPLGSEMDWHWLQASPKPLKALQIILAGKAHL